MLANHERKLSVSSLIPLEIDPVSILSLSKGVIFDTIVHNIDYTFSNRITDPLPWKLVGMSLICDPSRTKKFTQKLQKMQCVSSVICTQIYHSKLIKNEFGALTTPGRKLVIPTIPRKRLTGVIVCRSVDELLSMEPSNVDTVHIIQYKLLAYERRATRELINGPKLPIAGEKIIKTVFDFELTQNNGFPRQLLPVAIISFSRQEGCNLCLSIRNFLKLDEHQVFDKSYLVTVINVECDRLRQEQESREEMEAEQELPWEKAQPRQPLADLSKKTTDIGNARPSTAPRSILRVPPLKIKLPYSEKTIKPTISTPSIESKYNCLLKLDRVDLSLYNISNLPSVSKPTVLNELSPPPSSLDTIRKKTKSCNMTLTNANERSSKSLNSIEKNKTIAKDMSTVDSGSIPLSNNKRSLSLSSISTEIKTAEKEVIKKKIKRPALPTEYHCSISLSRIDLSMYDIDLPPVACSSSATSTNTDSPMTISSEQQIQSTNGHVEQETTSDPAVLTFSIEQEPILNAEQSDTSNTNNTVSSNIDKPLVTDVDQSVSAVENFASQKSVLTIVEDLSPISFTDDLENFTESASLEPEPISSKPTEQSQTEATDDAVPVVESVEPTQSTASFMNVSYSSDVPPLDDDPVLCSTEQISTSMNGESDALAQDFIIIVPCSDDDDDFCDDEENEEIFKNRTDTNIKQTESFLSPTGAEPSPTTANPVLGQALPRSGLVGSSHRSSTSSCSSLSTMIMNQAPGSPLHLTETLIPMKILNKKQQHKSTSSINLSRLNSTIPLLANEPLIDPRLIYRLQSITTDLHWPSPCNQCLLLTESPDSMNPPTPMTAKDKSSLTDLVVDPRRESLKQAILNIIYQRITILIPRLFIMNGEQFQKLLFEQTTFKTNCSIHLEYLLRKVKLTDDTNFFHMIRNDDEFQLSSSLLQLIFN